MPQAIAFITPYIASALYAISGSTAFVVAATGIIASALVYGSLVAASYLLQSAFRPDQPGAPKPADGKFNLKQGVPPLIYILGRVKKAGDYAFLEERGGSAFHIIVHAAHHVKAYTQHYLHDEPVGLDGSGFVVLPGYLGPNYVKILTRRGENASTAYENVTALFPEIWTPAHRGDGLATIVMQVGSVPTEYLQSTFPNNMPSHSAVIEGHDRLIDPRTGVAGYSENLAVFRYWHLSHPVGAKLTRQDLYTPEWAHAAEVGASAVTNRDGAPEPRYHGGLWFRANNSPVEIGRLLDQAAEMVIYERADGTIGVHAGEFVEPDVRLDGNDIISLNYDPNMRRSTNVLAVRGRYTDPDRLFNTADAAIYGDPYPSDDERTKTVDNQAVQLHNHIARLQKLAFIRANAPRVKIRAHYEPARQVPYRRFIRVHLPPKLDEAVIEITGRPSLSLRTLTYEFEGIVVPAALYDFDAATEEGAPAPNVSPVERAEVPAPTGFGVSVEVETVGGGSAYFGLASWTPVADDVFLYELEWEPTAGGPKQSVTSPAGASSMRSTYLADDVEVKFRLRRWSVGAPSNWTGYVTRTP